MSRNKWFPLSCWILCLPRSGSSYLAELLNYTDIFPVYERGHAFNEWLGYIESYNHLCSAPPSCCKAMYHHYVEVMNLIPRHKRWDQNRSMQMHIDKSCEDLVKQKFSLNSIQSILPGIKFIAIHRDPVDQSVSTFFARKSNKYHIYSEKELKTYMESPISVDFNDLANIYREIIYFKQAWSALYTTQTRVIDVNYQDLINNPFETLSTIFEFLELSVNSSTIHAAIQSVNLSKKRIYKMTRPESGLVADRLRGWINTRTGVLL